MAIIDIKILNESNFIKHIKDHVRLDNGTLMTVGRFLFNRYLGDEYIKTYGYVNKPITKKVMDKEVIPNLSLLYKDSLENVAEILHRLQTISYQYLTYVNPTFTINDITIYDEFTKYRDRINKASSNEEKLSIIAELQKEIQRYIKDNKMVWDTFMTSGARGSILNLVQLVGVKGGITNMNDELDTIIERPIAEGLTPTQLFASGVASRKGIADRALNTAITGYLERKLVYCLSSLRVNMELEDCKTEKYFEIKINNEIQDKLINRYVLHNNKLELVTSRNINILLPIGRVVKLRSPIFCKSPLLCKTCYGNLINFINTPNVGVLSGSTIGEIGSQLIMRTFHVGAASEISKVDILEHFYNNQNNESLNYFNSLFNQVKNSLFAKRDMKIELIIEQSMKTDIERTKDGNIILPLLSGHVIVNNKRVPINLDEACIFINSNEAIHTYSSDRLIIDIKAGGKILDVYTGVVNMAVMMKQVVSTLQKKILKPNIIFIFNRIFNKYKDSSDIDLVHFEMILTACLRNKTNPFLQARLVKNYDPIFYSIKDVPYLENYKLGMQFENLNKAIEIGLIEDKNAKKLKDEQNIDKPVSPLVRL